jgi:hypothetical protein
MKKNNQLTKICTQRENLGLILGAGLLTAGNMIASQSVFYTTPVVPVTPVAERADFNSQTNSAQVFVPSGVVNKSEVPEIFRQGPLTLRPHVDYQFLYGNGLRANLTNSTDTAIQTLSPGFLLEIGKHWALDYTPTFSFYSSDKFRDTVAHSVSLTGGTQYNDWNFGLSQTYMKSTDPLAETGAQTDQQSFGTSLSAACILNEKFSLDLGLNQRIQDTTGYQGSRDWSTSAFLNYQFFPRLTVGLGTVLGFVNVDTGPDQGYEQLQARVNWRITDKLGLSLTAGGEDRQFFSSGLSDSMTPTLSAALQYQPRERTQFSLTASHAVAPSLFAFSPATETSSVSAGINQRLFKKFQLELNGSYNASDYKVSLPGFVLPPGFALDRQDDYYAFSARLSHPFLKRGNISIFYQYSDNKSTAALFTYRSTQIGCQVGYAF